MKSMKSHGVSPDGGPPLYHDDCPTGYTRKGRQRRLNAEKELANIEDQLKKKLLEINQ